MLRHAKLPNPPKRKRLLATRNGDPGMGALG
jgi:hypothetical protein